MSEAVTVAGSTIVNDYPGLHFGCTIKQLEPAAEYRAALEAMALNPANRAPIHRLMPLGIMPTPDHIAVMTTKWWPTHGVDLTVGFLEQTSAALAEKIVSHMNAWGTRCNVVFRLQPVGSTAKVRISRKPGGYWSYLGTDILQVPMGQPTMNLEAFSLSTPDSEFYRVVRHETAHTLACPHEHMRRQIVQRIDPDKAIAYFMQTQGWTAQEVRQQVLTPLEESSITGTPEAEDDSIMTYQLPGSIMKDGQPVVGGKDITEHDYAFMATIYPKTVSPPQPPTTSWRIEVNSPCVITGSGVKPVVK